MAEQQTLAQRVYDRLHERLVTGRLRPGARLVNRALAAELGTSTIPVREAIGRLAGVGLLEVTAGAGARVRTPGPNELGELYDLREALEALAAAEAARFANDHLIAELRAECEAFRVVAGGIPAGRGRHATAAQFARWLGAEERFHARVVAASRNRWLVKAVRELRVIARVFAAQRAAPTLLTRERAKQTLGHHEAFLRILADHDAERARAWMTAHIRAGRDEVIGHLAAGASLEVGR